MSEDEEERKEGRKEGRKDEEEKKRQVSIREACQLI